MSNVYVTPTGLVLPTFQEIKAELEVRFQTALGSDIDLSPEGALGQFVDLMAKSVSDAYLAIEEIHTARHPNAATGTSLDNISAETGIRRIDASATVVQDVVLYGTEGTVVTAGSIVRQSDTSNLFLLDAARTISATAARDCWLEPTNTTVGIVYSILVNGVAVEYTVQTGDTLPMIISELIAEIALLNPGSFTTNGGTAISQDTTFLRLTSLLNDFTISWNAELTLEKVGSAGNFTCDAEGVTITPANTLTVITTPISGWNEANNPLAGLPGRAVETDQELRIRRSATLGAGSATETAIRNQILNTVDGIVAVSVTSNRTMTTDGDGRPPKSFEVVADGGVDTDIAQTIWNHMPAGIEAFGDLSANAIDIEGVTHVINFSRPIQKYLHVRVQRSLYDEEAYPVDGDLAIKNAIVAWTAANYDLGTDVIYQRLIVPVYTVSGIGSVVLTVDVTDAPGDTPTYVAANFPISAKQFVTADIARIVVETL